MWDGSEREEAVSRVCRESGLPSVLTWNTVLPHPFPRNLQDPQSPTVFFVDKGDGVAGLNATWSVASSLVSMWYPLTLYSGRLSALPGSPEALLPNFTGPQRQVILSLS